MFLRGSEHVMEKLFVRRQVNSDADEINLELMAVSRKTRKAFVGNIFDNSLN